MTKGKTFLKLFFRIAVILLPFLATLAWKKEIKKESVISGIYDVEKMTINNIPFNLKDVKNIDSVLTRIYFETNNVCVLQDNNFKKRVTAHYVYNEKLSQLQGILNNSENTALNFRLTKRRDDTVRLDGTLSKNKFSLVLKKIE